MNDRTQVSISFRGSQGAGKTLLLRLLSAVLEDLGIEHKKIGENVLEVQMSFTDKAAIAEKAER